MRTATVSASLALMLMLAACSTTGGTNTYETELRKLSDDCQARGGILVATGQQSGRPQNDNVCEIRGGGGRLPNN
jgi:hypothetical protein